MSRIKFLSIFVLVALLLSAGPGVVLGKEPPPGDSVIDGHLLVRPEHVATFGDVIVTSPDRSLERGSVSIPGWEEARSTGIAVTSPKPGEYAAQIVSSSYKFSSPESAQAALASLPDPREAGVWSDGTSLLDDELAALLDARSVRWDVVCVIDDEGLPTYGFSVQIGSYVADVYIIAFATTVADELTSGPSASDEEKGREYIEVITRKLEEGMTFKQLVDTERAHSFGQRLLGHVVERLINQDSASVLQAHPLGGSRPILILPAAPSPMGYTSARASHWVDQHANGQPCSWWDPSSDCHHLATWDYSYGHNPHYHGIGGDGLTCQLGGEHGCIGNWSWWLQVPESRLGVPKTFYFGAVWSGSMNAYNYSATVWVP